MSIRRKYEAQLSYLEQPLKKGNPLLRGNNLMLNDIGLSERLLLDCDNEWFHIQRLFLFLNELICFDGYLLSAFDNDESWLIRFFGLK